MREIEWWKIHLKIFCVKIEENRSKHHSKPCNSILWFYHHQVAIYRNEIELFSALINVILVLTCDDDDNDWQCECDVKEQKIEFAARKETCSHKNFYSSSNIIIVLDDFFSFSICSCLQIHPCTGSNDDNWIYALLWVNCCIHEMKT